MLQELFIATREDDFPDLDAKVDEIPAPNIYLYI